MVLYCIYRDYLKTLGLAGVTDDFRYVINRPYKPKGVILFVSTRLLLMSVIVGIRTYMALKNHIYGVILSILLIT